MERTTRVAALATTGLVLVSTLYAAGPASASASGNSTAVQRCHTGALKAKVGGQDAGAGQRYAQLILTNKSSRSCWLYGFPGLIMFDSHGDALRTRPRREAVTPHKVVLKPGKSAHARLHWGVIQTGSETTCPTSARLMIIPPDEVNAHLEIPFVATACDAGRIDMRPFAA
ncbi:DUF4232 domain-containing protein [Streptosporangiaceae bacterium NEAU-GS5]|nr:DUF4232 domain-containing protein [Streptosporangiaceae bacterium NEAU-GS5]